MVFVLLTHCGRVQCSVCMEGCVPKLHSMQQNDSSIFLHFSCLSLTSLQFTAHHPPACSSWQTPVAPSLQHFNMKHLFTCLYVFETYIHYTYDDQDTWQKWFYTVDPQNQCLLHWKLFFNPFSTTPAKTGHFNMFCLTPDDFTCQGRSSGVKG